LRGLPPVQNPEQQSAPVEQLWPILAKVQGTGDCVGKFVGGAVGFDDRR